MPSRPARTLGLLSGLLLLTLAAAVVVVAAFLAGVRVLISGSSGQLFFGVVLPLAALLVLGLPGGLLIWWSRQAARRYRPPAMQRLDQLMGRAPGPVNPRYVPGRAAVAAADIKPAEVPRKPSPRPRPRLGQRAERRLPWQ